MKWIDLSGSWQYRLDPEDVGITERYYTQRFCSGDFHLPGTTCEHAIGTKLAGHEDFTRDNLRAPRERYEYIAPLWLQKEIEISGEDVSKSMKLYLERVNMASMLWIDGQAVGRQVISLCTPHIYNVSKLLTEGKHVITLRIDNRNLITCGDMSSGYSVDTQGIWNGIIGRIGVQCDECFRVEDVQVYPDAAGISVRVVETSDIRSPQVKLRAVTKLTVVTPEGVMLEPVIKEHEVYHSKHVAYYRYEIPSPQYWNEFTPSLYQLKVEYTCEGISTATSVSFGMRTICSKQKALSLNGRPLSLRGTTDCAQFPLTGYPDMDEESWRRRFEIVKSYGMNHVRFHAWCPPESAFMAADKVGMYLSVEMPLWLNFDVCPYEVGDDSIHESFFTQEAVRISKNYGNHPSFVMFSNGNENMGDVSLLEDMLKQVKGIDPRRLYTLTSNFDHPVLPCEDYLCAFEAGGHKIRIQDIHDRIAKDTCYAYDEAVWDSPVPIISFEVGQYCLFPDVDIVEDYTGNMSPINFATIRKRMQERGVYHRLAEYVQASGKLAALLYKEDIECALRTRGMGGIELLSLYDYTGQSTATVGMLDIFLRNKGILTAEEFRSFCGPVVPLFMAKRIYTNDETLHAKLDVYDYGETSIEKPLYELVIMIEDKLFYETKTTSTSIEIPLEDIREASCLQVTLTVGEYANHWNVYVYPKSLKEIELPVCDSVDELRLMIENGGKAVVTAKCMVETRKGDFIPVFWSPVHFETLRASGAILQETHPIFDRFPTQHTPDYQWKRLLDASQSVVITGMQGLNQMMEIIPNFVDCAESTPLFECKIGKASILYCGFDLRMDAPEVRQLRYSIGQYVESEQFAPKVELTIEQARCLFKI